MNWLRRFFYGRNGIDQLSLAILIFGAVALIVAQLTHAAPPGLLYYFCTVLFFYRCLSRNVYKRRSENLRYMGLLSKIKRWFQLRVRMVREARTHVYLRCPHCKQRIRAPRGKGQVLITCQRCRQQFGCKI